MRLLCCLASLSAAWIALNAEEDRSSPIFAPVARPESAAKSRESSPTLTRMQQQVVQQVKIDAGKISADVRPVRTEPPVATEDMIELDPMKVQAQREMRPVPKETGFQHYLRTGTLWESKDKRMRLGLAPDKGLFFNFAW